MSIQGDATGMSIYFKMNIYCISITTEQNSLCFRCAFQLQSRKRLKLYSCTLKWSQNPIIQSHFSVDSHYKKEVCFGRTRIKRFAGKIRTFPRAQVSSEILSDYTGLGTNVGLARLRGQMTETGIPSAQCGAQHGISPIGMTS